MFGGEPEDRPQSEGAGGRVSGRLAAAPRRPVHRRLRPLARFSDCPPGGTARPTATSAADGYGYDFIFSKPRKIERLLAALEEEGIAHKLYPHGEQTRVYVADRDIPGLVAG